MTKKLLKDNKELMKQWDYEKNKDVDVSKITFSSGKKFWWKCTNGHSHYARVSEKNRGLNCPYCSGKKVLVGYNDLFTILPNLKKEWDYEKNDINPCELRPGSNKDAYWICSNNHKYKMRISHRTEGHGCPYCAGNKVLKGYNDLETWCKQNNNKSLEKWDYKKNKNKPSEYSKSSKEYVWWKCSICGNEYKNKISNEISNIYCPKCNKRNRTSFPELLY